MAEIGSLSVSLSMDASNFNGSLSQVDRNLKSMGSELKAVKARGTEYGNSIEGLSSRQDILRRSLDAANIKLTATRKKYDEMVASGTASEAQLERQARRVNEAQAQYNRLEAELNDVDAALRRQSSSWNQMSANLTQAGTTLRSFGQGMTNIGRDLSMKITAPIMALGVGAFKAAMDFETAFTNVSKYMGKSREELKHLEQGIRDMAKASPFAATEISKVAASATQLGIEEKNLLSFSKTMLDIGVSSNLTADQAAVSFARFANITGMPQEKMENLGSSVVGLGNKFAAMESEIMEMAMRLAGAGTTIGLTEGQILGMSTALTVVGINAEAGGSAFSKLMVDMASEVATNGKKLEGFAKVAGMSAKDFQKAFKEDAGAAIVSFIKGLGEMQKNGENVFGVIDDLGLSEIRLRDALLRSAGASDEFTAAMATGSEEFEKNNALAETSGAFYETTANKIKVMVNKVKDLAITLGNNLIPIVMDFLEKLDPIIQKFAEMDSGMQKTILAVGGVAAAIGPILVVGGTLITSLGTIATAAGTVSGAIGVITTGAAAATPAIGMLASVFTTLSGPIGWTIAGLTAVGIGAYKLSKDLKQDAIPEINRFGDEVSDATKKALDGFFQLSDGASQKVMELSLTQKAVTEDMANDLLNTFSCMKAGIIANLSEEKPKGFFSRVWSFIHRKKQPLIVGASR